MSVPVLFPSSTATAPLSAPAVAAPATPVVFESFRSALEGSSPWAWLVEVEVPTSPPTRYRLTSHTSELVFGSDSAGDPITYYPFPLSIEGFDQTKEGNLEEVTLKIANVTREIGATLDTYGGLTGQEVIIRLVNLATLLDSNAQIVHTTTVRSAAVGADVCSFTLSPYNLLSERVPKFRFLQDHCPVLFGGPHCGYAIPATTGETVGTGFSTCPKTRAACTLRGDDEVSSNPNSSGGGTIARQHPERFAGWPGIPRLSERVSF